MKTIPLWSMLSAVSLLAMVWVDRLLGAKAEFMNAWSVMERLAGRSPSAGHSAVFLRFGAAGEFLIVVLINIAIGGLLALLVKRVF